MKSLLLAATLAMIAGQSHALSCVRPDPVWTFSYLDDQPEAYFVVHGQLLFDETLLPTTVSNDQRRRVDPIPARFVGKSLSAEGFVTDYMGDMTLQIGCAGPWCGTAQSGVDALIFVAAERPLTVEAGPCGGRIFESPTPAVLDALTACMQGGPCSSEALE